jgi:hypothetical protein
VLELVYPASQCQSFQLAAANSNARSQGTEPKGIETAVSNQLKNGSIGNAISLLEGHGIEYDYAEISMPTIDYVREQEDDFSIETWDKDESRLSHIAYHKGGDTYHSYLSWQLELLEHRACVDTTSPDDGVGLTVGDASWEPVINSWEFGNNTYFEDRGEITDTVSPAASALDLVTAQLA